MTDLLLPVLLHLPTPDDLAFIPRPTESHNAFGAAMFFLAALIFVEALAGSVWHRSMLRRMLFPAILVLLGWGMILVALIEPNARLVHVIMGIPMIAGGWAEARYRLGDLERKYADALIVPALVLASVDILGFHLSGPTPVVMSHASLGVLVLVMAGFRLYQSAAPASVPRSMLIGLGIAAVGLVLWFDALFQSNV